MKMESLKELYLEQLRDLYSAETQLVEALPKMAEGAHDPSLKTGLSDHLGQRGPRQEAPPARPGNRCAAASVNIYVDTR